MPLLVLGASLQVQVMIWRVHHSGNRSVSVSVYHQIYSLTVASICNTACLCLTVHFHGFWNTHLVRISTRTISIQTCFPMHGIAEDGFEAVSGFWKNHKGVSNAREGKHIACILLIWTGLDWSVAKLIESRHILGLKLNNNHNHFSIVANR